MASSSQGQTSSYFAMTVAGLWQGWNPNGRNLVNYSNYAWEGTFFLSSAQSNEFKFTANGSWDVRNWGETNQSIFADPLSGTAEINGGNIRHTAIRDGFYRFQFNETSGAYSVELVGYSLFESNLLKNGSFEAAGSSSGEAKYWELGYPNYQGGRYGSSGRVDWRSTDGSNEVFMGTSPNFGGWYQDAPAGEDFEYEVSAWYWADAIPPYGPWTAGVQELKIEFYGPQYGTALSTVATNFHDITDSFKQKQVRAKAPAGTAWARFVMGVGSVSTNGSLQMDAVSMTSFPIRIQSFDSWSFASNSGFHVRGDWQIQTGRVLNGTNALYTNLVYSGSSAALVNTNAATNLLGNGGSLRSPRLAGGIGRVTFWYRHGETNEFEVPTNSISFVLQKSGDGSNWTTVAEQRDITSQEYLLFSKFLYDPTSHYARVIHAGGTNELFIDDFSVALATPISRTQDFNDWPTNNVSPGVYTNVEWMVGTGTVATISARDGQAAKLMGVTSGANFVRSPQFTNGYGNISFYYARGTNGSGATAFQLQRSPDGTNWTTLDAITGITLNAYTAYNEFYYFTNSSFIRIANLPVASIAGQPAEVLNEGFTGYPTQTNLGWSFTSISTYDNDTSAGVAAPALQFNATGDRVITPTFSNATNLVFWTKGQSLSGSTLLLESQTTTDGTNWLLVTNYASIPNTERTNAVVLSTNVTRLRWTYTKSAGNMGFDDVLVLGPPTAAQPPQQLLIDDIVIDDPVLLRTMDFDDWSGASSPVGNYKFKGWKIVDGRVDSVRAVSGLAGRLDESPANGQYIQSPFFPDGIGPVSFSFSCDDSTPATTNITYQLQTSTNGTNWTLLQQFQIPTTLAYQDFALYQYNPTGQYLRIFHTNGGVRVAFDNINFAAPSPPADVDLSGYIEPSTPFTNDAVTVHAVAIPLYGAKNLAVTSYYRIGTSGAFNVLPMAFSNFISYASLSSIAPQKAGTTVQWYVSCTFTGAGSSLTSPRYYPAGGINNPADYRIPRSPQGQVWINEVNFFGNGGFLSNDTDFVELAGPTGFNLSGWRLELLKTTNSFLTQSYIDGVFVISNGTVLPPDTPLYGFWVLGQSNVVNRDMLMTNFLASTDTNTFGQWQFGVRLLNEAGGVEAALSFAGNLTACSNIPISDDIFDNLASVALTGTGFTQAAFAWYVTNPISPGAINSGQSFGSSLSGIPTNVWVVRITMGTNVTVVTTGNTNSYGVLPYYATNLLATPQTWQPVTPFNSILAGDTNTITFDRQTGNVPYFYTIFTTNGP